MPGNLAGGRSPSCCRQAHRCASVRTIRSSGNMSDILALAWHRYLRSLQENPLRTKSATSATLAALSNIIAQRLMSNAPINWRRAFAMSGFGFFFAAPATHYWHKVLDRLFPRAKNGKKDEYAPYKKVLLDVLTFGPLFNLVALTYISTIVDGRSLNFTQRKIQQDYPSIVLNGLKVWPIVHFVNFKYVPPQLRVPFVSIASLFWSVFLLLRAKGTLQVRT